MSETQLLAHIYERSAGLAARFPHVLVGPGHDCAAVRVGPTSLLKVDQLIEGVHFVPATPIDLIARKAIARAVSDVAAAAGTPRAALAAAMLPRSFTQGDALFDATARWAEHFGCPLVGGDIAAAPTGVGLLLLSVTIVGEPHPARGPVLRSGAVPGDAVYMTGSLGGSFERRTGLGRHLTFEPRLAEAAWLAGTLGASLHAMMDLSDGLGVDAGRLARASGVKLRLEAAALPINIGVPDWRTAASAGEDYELLFCAPPGVPARCPATGVTITRIGSVQAGSGCAFVEEGREIDGSAMGWEHPAG